MRKHLSQILETASIEINREYSRLYEMFYKTFGFGDDETTLEKLVAADFINIPFRGTCISLDDFNISNGFCFEESPRHFDMRYRVPIKEYPYTGDGFVTYRVSVEDYDYSKAKDIKMDLDQLCNKIIHSYVWSVIYTGKDVHGVVFASDKEKTDKLYLLKLSDWIDMLQYCIDEACV